MDGLEARAAAVEEGLEGLRVQGRGPLDRAERVVDERLALVLGVCHHPAGGLPALRGLCELQPLALGVRCRELLRVGAGVLVVEGGCNSLGGAAGQRVVSDRGGPRVEEEHAVLVALMLRCLLSAEGRPAVELRVSNTPGPCLNGGGLRLPRPHRCLHRFRDLPIGVNVVLELPALQAHSFLEILDGSCYRGL